MSLAPWRLPLASALQRNRSLIYSRYVQLATVRPNGRPANRTIVFRGFLPDTDFLKFVTDSRSDKAEQINLYPWGEICWYFPKTREQFRISGRLNLIAETCPEPSQQQARKTAWQELSDAARLQFAWPHPGYKRADVQAFTPSPPDAFKPLPNFCLLLLIPETVDHLELRGEPQNRQFYQLENHQWVTTAINP